MKLVIIFDPNSNKLNPVHFIHSKIFLKVDIHVYSKMREHVNLGQTAFSKTAYFTIRPQVKLIQENLRL